MSPKTLPVLLTLLAVCSLAAGCCLDVFAPAHAQEAWTAFLGFSGALLGVHIPAPGQVNQ